MNRHKRLARHLAMLALRRAGLGLKAIAQVFGLKSHATVIDGVSRLKNMKREGRDLEWRAGPLPRESVHAFLARVEERAALIPRPHPLPRLLRVTDVKVFACEADGFVVAEVSDAAVASGQPGNLHGVLRYATPRHHLPGLLGKPECRLALIREGMPPSIMGPLIRSIRYHRHDLPVVVMVHLSSDHDECYDRMGPPRQWGAFACIPAFPPGPATMAKLRDITQWPGLPGPRPDAGGKTRQKAPRVAPGFPVPG